MSILEKLTLNIKEKNLQELLPNDVEDELKLWTGLKTIIMVNSYTVMGLLAVEKLISHQQMVGNTVIEGGTDDYNTLVQEISHIALFEKSALEAETTFIDGTADSKDVSIDDNAGVTLGTSEQENKLKNTTNYTVMDDLIVLLWKITDKNEQISLQVLKLLLTIVTSDKTEIHRYSLILAFKICFNIYSWFDAKTTNHNTARASLTQMISMTFVKLERVSSSFDPSVDVTSHLTIPEIPMKAAQSDSRLEQTAALSLLRQDVLMTLRFLVIHAGSSAPEKVFKLNQESVLALEIILQLFTNLGNNLRQDPGLFQLVKSELCPVLEKVSVSLNPEVFQLGLSIFLIVQRHFHEKLKLEIEIQLVTYLQILEMSTSTYKQKSTILQGLLKICENPQLLVDMYLNYDCEFEMSSIYEKMVNICTKITQGRTEAGKQPSSVIQLLGLADHRLDIAKKQDRRIHVRALCILTSISESLVKFYQEHEDSEKTSAVLSADQESLKTLKGSDLNAVSSENDSNAAQMISRKQTFKQAIQLFNQKPLKGLKALIQGGFVENTIEAQALFLFNTQELDKHAIGEVLGDGDSENIKIMHHYCDLFNLKGAMILDALRAFLKAFRLPGESQKIDRIIEKFADRYCENNPEIFANADAAYTFAFSIIMLNTDLHSSQVKHKMDKKSFININREAINDSEELPTQLLESIYDDILNNEIVMDEERNEKLLQLAKGFGGLNDRQKMENYLNEVNAIQRKNQLLMTQGKNGRTVLPFKSAASKELSRLMFTTCSWAMMASLSLSFEAGIDPKKDDNEPNVPDLCLKGFEGAIKLSLWFRLETERDAYVSSLAKLTALTHFYELTPKNIRAINLLIQLACNYGEYLDNSWIDVVKTLSLLEKMQVVVLRGEALQTAGASRRSSVDRSHGYQELSPLSDSKPTPAISKILEEYVEQVQSQSTLLFIDKIFTSSVNLSAHAIVHFFKAICLISLDEVSISPTTGEYLPTSFLPRMYLLQKIVEIAYYNMHRIRFEWTQIWRILQPHFNMVACHPDLKVASFAVDSLRQLGMKFLEREELGQFSTQLEFLKSFEWIIKNNSQPAIREMILNSLSQMITARASRIRSGWKSIFGTLVKAAQTDAKLAQQSFHISQMIFKQHFEEAVSAGAFVDLVFCLAEFALLKGSGPVHDELLMSNIQMLQSCTNSLFERAKNSANLDVSNQIQIINNLPNQQYLLPSGLLSEEHFHLSWFPVLSQFTRIVTESEGVLIRTHTMEILFETLKNSCHLFACAYWKTISRNIIFPIFEDLNEATTVGFKESSSAVLIHGLRLLMQLISQHFELLVKPDQDNDTSGIDFLFKSVDLMVEMMSKPDDKLASTGQTCFRQFLVANVQKFDEKLWQVVSSKIQKAFRNTIPAELVKCKLNPSDPVTVPSHVYDASVEGSKFIKEMNLDSLEFEKTVLKCVGHLELLLTVRDFCTSSFNDELVICSMPAEARNVILECLYQSYSIARVFNSNLLLRQAIHKRGWVTQLPNLVKQESTSLSIYMTLLFNLAIKSNGFKSEISREIIDLFSRFEKLLNDPTKLTRELQSFTPLVLLILNNLIQHPQLWKQEGELKEQHKVIYQYLVKLVMIENLEIRQNLVQLLLLI